MRRMHKENNLTKNQQIIFDLIDKSSEPMKAYSILFNVQKKGIKAPLQVYRALDKLVEILLNQETIDKKVFKLTTSKLLKV